jgi:hypothetical protein
MAVFPDTPKPKQPSGYSITQVWRTTSAGFDAGNETRYQKWVFPRYDVTLKYPPLTEAMFQILWSFYQARKGAYEAFHFVDYRSMTWDTPQYIDVGDGTTLTFDIPGLSTSAQAIYVDGIAVDPGDYAILSGGGAASSDRVTFDVAPALGSVIGCTFTGYLRSRNRFSQDKMSKQHFEVALFTTGLELKGLMLA